MAVASSSEASPASQLAEAVKRFARSVELCDDYLRGYYGLKLVCHNTFSCLWIMDNKY